MTSRKDLDYYMQLPYKIEVTPEEDGTGFTAEIPDLKGCMASGETIEDAFQTIVEVKKAWIEIALARGWRIREPISQELKEYSGRFNVRLPRYLHRELAQLAQVEGTSLNQLVVAFLAEGAERRHQTPQAAQRRVLQLSLPAESLVSYGQLLEFRRLPRTRRWDVGKQWPLGPQPHIRMILQ